MKRTNTLKNGNATFNITVAGLIAALYVVLTVLAQMVGLASGVIQFRISEALTILPVFTSAAIPGLAIGCLIANIVTGCALWDIVFGTLATFLGAVGTWLIGRTGKAHLGVIPPILANVLIVPAVLIKVYGVDGSYPYFMLTVGIGEVVCCGILGILLYNVLVKTKVFQIGRR